MRSLLFTPFLLAVAMACGQQDPSGTAASAMTDPVPQHPSFYDLTATDINGQPFAFSQLKGHKVMVVNTASECGYTPQYKQLEELYAHYQAKGFIIVGFPSNDFGGQEPGDEHTIAQFCQKNYGVTFPMMSKIITKGEGQSPVYAWLTQQAKNGKQDSEVKWNFQKYLIGPDGELVDVLPSAQEPTSQVVLDWLDAK